MMTNDTKSKLGHRFSTAGLVGGFLLTVLLVAGCARHVVVLPADVDYLNDDHWTIHASPGAPADDEESDANSPR